MAYMNFVLSIFKPRSIKSSLLTGILVLSVIYFAFGPTRRLRHTHRTLRDNAESLHGKIPLDRKSLEPLSEANTLKDVVYTHKPMNNLQGVSGGIEKGEEWEENRTIKTGNTGVEVKLIDDGDVVSDDVSDDVVEVKPDTPNVKDGQPKGQGENGLKSEAKENTRNKSPQTGNVQDNSLERTSQAEGIKENQQKADSSISNETKDAPAQKKSKLEEEMEEKNRPEKRSKLVEEMEEKNKPENKSKLEEEKEEKNKSENKIEHLEKDVGKVKLEGSENKIESANGTVNSKNNSQATIQATTKAPAPQIVNPHDFKYIINNESICSAGHASIHHLIYFHSSPGSAKERMSLRRGWAQNNLFPNLSSRVVFFMGRPKEDALVKKVIAEASLHGDIVMEDYQDSYNNMTYKAIGAMKWISTFCNNTKFVIKADQDVYVNLFVTIRRLLDMTKTSRFFMCGVYIDGTMPILRDPKNCYKWCVPKHIFPGKKAYPTYCAGASYIFSSDLATGLYNSSLYTPYFYIDDVYITGLLPQKLPKVDYKAFPARALLVGGRGLRETMQKPNATYNIIGIHDPSSRDPSYYWRDHLQHLGPDQVDMLGKDRHQTLLAEAKTLENDFQTGNVK